MIERNREGILKFLTEAEQRLPVNEWQTRGVRVWPMVRIKLFFNLIFALEKHANESPVVVVSTWQKVMMLVDAFRYRMTLPSKKNIQTLYAGFFAHRVSYKEQSFNRFFDPLMDREASSGNASILVEYVRNKQRQGYYKSDRVIEGFRLFPTFARTKQSIDIHWSEDVAKLIGEANAAFGVAMKPAAFVASCKSDVSRIFVHERLFLFLLNKYNPRNVVCLTYYNPAVMGLILAARKKGIPVAELQHGPQGALHAAYASWTNMPQEGYALLPDTFWCWNASDAQEINKSTEQKNIRAHHAIAFGNPWVEFWKNSDRESMYKHWPNNVILYTLQPVEGVLEPYLIEVIRNTQHEFAWWFRLHPRQLEQDRRLIEDILRREGLDGVVNIADATQLPLPDVLRHTRVHITKYSGCFLEAMEFNVPSIIIDERGVRIFADHVANENVSVVLEHDASKITSAIRRHFSGNKK